MSKILGPIISEKSMSEASKGRFTFRVLRSATKAEIKKEVEKRFKVNVVKTFTVNIKGRSLRAGVRREEVSLAPFKKAIVVLKKDQKITLFDIGGKE